MNREMPLHGTIDEKIEMAPAELIARCKTLHDAAVLSVQLSRHAHETLAKEIGMDKGNFSRFMSGRANIPLRKIPAFMRVCGYYAMLQWLANYFGFDLVKKVNKQRIEELEEELQHLQRTG